MPNILEICRTVEHTVTGHARQWGDFRGENFKRPLESFLKMGANLQE